MRTGRKTMKKISNIQQMKKIIKFILILSIFLYPFIHSFIGIDLGDTGYHLYAFENLYKTPELIGFTSYFTNFVGWLWLTLFSDLGLWGLNFLEVMLEMCMAFVVYKTVKPFLGEIQTLIGILIAVTASDTYLNIFNYHQFNVFLLILIMCFQFWAITKEKIRYSILSGICFAIVVFSRMGSVTAIVTCFIYVFWYLIQDKKASFLWKNLGTFLSGTVFMSGGMLLLLKATGQLEYFVNNIFRLSGLASTSDGGYGMDSLLETFFKGNLDAIASGAIFLAAFIVLLLGIGVFVKKGENLKHKVINVLLGGVITGIAVYQFIYAYNVNPVQAWPQMTTGPSFIIGVFYVITFLCLFYHMYGERRRAEIALLSVIAILLPLLTIAGSNTGTKHVILGLWIIAPVCTYLLSEFLLNNNVRSVINQILYKFGIVLSRKIWIVCLCIVTLCFCGKFVNMLYYTMNFDSVDRSMINSKIDNPKVKYLLTTEREADAVNGVLSEIDKKGVKEEYPLMVFGGSIIYYYLTGMESFVQPWVTNGVYSNETLTKDIENGYEKFEELPVIIYGRTNNYFGFYEFDYEKQVDDETYRTYAGKKDILMGFLEKNRYTLQYVNDYYLVMYPPNIADNEGENYKGYITGNWE